MKEYDLSIFIFRRDLRLNDNTALIDALKNSNYVIPIFIFTPEQLTNNPYKSDNCVQFMIESLEDLDKDLHKHDSKLFFFYGKPNKIIAKLLKDKEIEAVFVNQDYSPYSKERDEKIKKVCDDNDVDFIMLEDQLLNPVGSIRTTSGTIYEKFTPYYNKAKKVKVDSVKSNNYKNFISSRKRISGQFKGNKKKFYKQNNNLAFRGGRKLGLKRLSKINDFKDYNKERNILHIETTRLSAYIKFGCLSIREVFHKIKKKLGMKNDLIKQLYWRDFFFNVLFDNPHIASKNSKNKNFKKEYNKVPWIRYEKASKKEKVLWEKWKDGNTGFPVVDAAMREMNVTGYMHNRGRLIVAGFLTKLMMWHWEDGEKYFSNTLLDCDLSANNGGWQFCSGGGVDSQPYFRIFNPWLQSEKFDKDCNYIKKWCPELKNVEPKHIHQWNKWHDHEDYEDIDYFEPMIDYKKARKDALKKYKNGLY